MARCQAAGTTQARRKTIWLVRENARDGADLPVYRLGEEEFGAAPICRALSVRGVAIAPRTFTGSLSPVTVTVHVGTARAWIRTGNCEPSVVVWSRRVISSV
jgi:hypothetical protein